MTGEYVCMERGQMGQLAFVDILYIYNVCISKFERSDHVLERLFAAKILLLSSHLMR